MGVFIGLIILIIALVLAIPFFIRLDRIHNQRYLEQEAMELRDYVFNKCRRNGLNDGECQVTADQYKEDFMSTINRRNMPLHRGNFKSIVSDIRLDFESEIDARMR